MLLCDRVTVDADADELKFEIEAGGPRFEEDQQEMEAAQPASAQTCPRLSDEGTRRRPWRCDHELAGPPSVTTVTVV